MKRAGGLLTLMALLLGVCSCGCGTPRGNRSTPIEVTLHGTSRVAVGAREVSLAKLPRALSGSGAGPETPIVVIVPESCPTQTLTDLTRRLRAAGYRRVMFRRPRTTKIEIPDP